MTPSCDTDTDPSHKSVLAAPLLLLHGATAPLLARLRGGETKQNDAAADAEASALFAGHVRRECAESSSPCVLDVCAKDILNYPQGSFALIADDLARAPPTVDRAASIRALRRACRLPEVFALRKELVNFKKACLRLLHDAQKLEKDLQRHEMFFFRDRDCDRWVEQGCVDPLYEKACHWHQRAKGLLLAVHDARDFGKMLCSLPRHPELAVNPNPNPNPSPSPSPNPNPNPNPTPTYDAPSTAWCMRLGGRSR